MPIDTFSTSIASLIVTKELLNPRFLWKNSADDKMMKFNNFKKTAHGILCKLPPSKTLCVEYQALFYKKTEEYITKTCLFKYTEKLITEKLKIFRQKIQIFFIFLLKT